MKKWFMSIPSIFLICLFVHAQSPKYRVYALRFASVGHPLPLKYLVLGAPDTATLNTIFMFWLIKSDNGRNILVDAGFLQDIEEAKSFDVTNYIRPDTLLLELNTKRVDITDIILSHPHWDHMDAVDLFPNAQVWMQKKDYSYFVGLTWQKDGIGGFNKRDVEKIADLILRGRLRLVDGDNKEIIPGIKVFTGSRHTFNSQYVLVKSGSKRIILASDNVYTYYNLNNLKSATTNATYDTTGYINEMKRMKTMASNINFIIPGHDASLFERFPVIKAGIIEIK